MPQHTIIVASCFVLYTTLKSQEKNTGVVIPYSYFQVTDKLHIVLSIVDSYRTRPLRTHEPVGEVESHHYCVFFNSAVHVSRLGLLHLQSHDLGFDHADQFSRHRIAWPVNFWEYDALEKVCLDCKMEADDRTLHCNKRTVAVIHFRMMRRGTMLSCE